jgi:5'-nucleotidase
MHILLSNDDGYLAPGINRLAKALEKYGHITMVAPDRDRSGASNSLTLTRPIRARQVKPNVYHVDGTPTDCVHLAITGLLDQEPDMVISGINNGANLGDDILYSGTVAAAMEGRFLGFPAIAVSLTGMPAKHYETAVYAVEQILNAIDKFPATKEMILNVNVPDKPKSDIRGMKITRLGNRHKAEPVVKMLDPRGEPVFWVGPAGEEQDAGPGTDFHAIKNDFISITPLQVDITAHKFLKEVEQWLLNGDDR